MKKDSAADDLVAQMVAQFGDLAATLREVARQHGNGESSRIEAALAQVPASFASSQQRGASSQQCGAASQTIEGPPDDVSGCEGLEIEIERSFAQLYNALEAAATSLGRAQRDGRDENSIVPGGAEASNSLAMWRSRITGMFGALLELCRMSNRQDLAARFEQLQARINKEN